MNHFPTSPSPPHGRGWRLVGRLSWLYFLGLLIAWGLLEWASDAWWPATVLMYSPRWVLGLPLLVLLPAALRVRRSLAGLLLVCLFLVLVPIMGLCVPWQTWLAGPASSNRLRVLSLNVDRKDLDPLALAAVVAEVDADIVALQDWSRRDEKLVFQAGDWHISTEGQFCLGSRFPIRDVEAVKQPPSCFDAFCRYELDTPMGRLHFFNVHLYTPRRGLSSVLRHWWDGAEELEKNTERRREQSARGTSWVRQFEGPLLIAGDFNTPIESTVYKEHWSGFTNAYEQAGFGWGHTYRNNRTGLRIDHILAGRGWICRRCWVGTEVGSEHRPLIAELDRSD